MARPEAIPQAEETLLFSDAGRRRLPVWFIIGVLVAPLLYFGSPFIAPRYLEHPLPVAIAFAGFLLLLIPLDLLLLNRWLGRWRVAVTNRRIVLRKGPFGLWRDEMDLSRLADVRHEWRRGRLILAAADRTLTIRCSDAIAKKNWRP